MGNQICCQQTIPRTPFGSVQQSFSQVAKHPLQNSSNTSPPYVQPPKHSHNPPAEHPQPEPQRIPVPEPRPTTVIQTQPNPSLPRDNSRVDLVEIPQVPPEVTRVLAAKRFFHYQEEEQIRKNQRQVKRYGEDVYVGSLDKDGLRPQGFGKMYKQDKGLYIGFFQNGRAHGNGAYLFPDGSYYFGDFQYNKAQSKNGQFRSKEMVYRGGFRNNVFDGQAIEEGVAQDNKYIFNGQFSNGSRKYGELKWNNGRYIYIGTFNSNNQFHGQGRLVQPQGTYKGHFVNGLKEGKGIYDYANGKRYHGDYSKGQRAGEGTIYLKSGKIEYKGHMSKGLPHGKGFIMVNDQEVHTTWIEGIDVNYLEPLKR